MADSIAADSALWGDYVHGVETSKIVTEKPKSNEMDKDAFLKLLITQLQYQDPLNPMDNQQFAAQMAQFTALEQMTNLNTNAKASQAFGMIGKTIAANIRDDVTNTYNQVIGKVDSVRLSGSNAILIVAKEDGKEAEVKVDDVNQVFEDFNSSSTQKAIMNNLYSMQNIDLVGKYVQAVTLDAKGEITGFIEGRVDNVSFVEGTPLLLVGNEKIRPQEVINVGEKMQIIGSRLSIYAGTDDEAAAWHTGNITGLLFSKDETRVVIDGKYSAVLDKIDVLGYALNSVGKQGTFAGVGGTITGVSVREGLPYLLMDTGEETIEREYSKVVVK